MAKVKSDAQIAAAVKRARNVVQAIYKDDPRIAKVKGPNDGVVRETEIVFQETLRYLLEN